MSVYAVNGKEPVAAWIPSLDTAGNGTTTLTDLVGSNDGTLTNMVAGSDWVADTDAGGVRALDFDGSNDKVVAPNFSVTGATATLSIWMKRRSAKALDGVLTNHNTSTVSDRLLSIFCQGTICVFNIGNGTATNTISASIGSSWTHVVGVRNGATMQLWLNGVLAASRTDAFATDFPTLTQPWVLGQFANSWAFDGLLDAAYVFDPALDSSDIAYLYNSGTGRGIVASSGAPAQNAQHNNLRNIRMAP